MYSCFTIILISITILVNASSTEPKDVSESILPETGSGDTILGETKTHHHQADAQFEDQILADDFSGEEEVTGFNLPLWSSDTGNKTTDKDLSSGSGEGPNQTSRPLPAAIEQSICSAESCKTDANGNHPARVTLTVTRGSQKAVQGVNVTLQCDVQLTNATASISWHLPKQASSGKGQDDLDGDKMALEEAEMLAGSEVLRSQVHLSNVTVTDAGLYTCLVLVTSHCCQHNASLALNVYRPHSYGYDVVIVGTVCFVELVVILYVKTRNAGQPESKIRRHKDVVYDVVKMEPEDQKQMV